MQLRYLIDGYNFLFRLKEPKRRSLEKRRDSLIEILNEELAPFKSHISLIFDSAEQICEYAQCACKTHLEVIYAPKGKTADCYILELVEIQQNPRMTTVVTSDSGLAKHCKLLGAKTLTIEEFIPLIVKKKSRKSPEKHLQKASKAEIERLRKIFEDRLNDLP